MSLDPDPRTAEEPLYLDEWHEQRPERRLAYGQGYNAGVRSVEAVTVDEKAMFVGLLAAALLGYVLGRNR